MHRADRRQHAGAAGRDRPLPQPQRARGDGRGDQGLPVAAAADRRRATPRPDDDAALLEDSAEDLYEHAPCGYLSTLPDGTIVRVNQTFLDLDRATRASELVGRAPVHDLLTAGGRIYHETHYAPLLRMQGSVREIALDMVRADGSRLPVLVNSQLRTGEDGRPLVVRTTVFDATDRKEYERELLAARRRAEQATAWVRSVEQVVAELAAVSGVDEVGQVVADAGTTAFAAAASVLWTRRPRDQRAGLDRGVRARSARPTTCRPRRTACRGVAAAARGRGRAGAGRTAARLPAAARGPRQPVRACSSSPRSSPWTGPSACWRCASARSRAPDPEELRLLQTLGQQAGLALERARLYDEQRSVATTLQRSMLPGSMPDDPRLGLSACYRPAVDVLEVGGDWYDAFLLDADRVGRRGR